MLINVPLNKCINERTWSLTVFGISSLETLRSEKSSFHLSIVLLQSCSFRAKSRSRNSRNSRNPYDLHATLTFTAFTSEGHLSHVSACCRAPACPIEVQHVSGTGAVCWIGNANRAWNDLTSPRKTPNTPAFTAWSQILVSPGDTWGRTGEDDWGILACFSFGLSVCSIATSKFSTSEGIARWQTVIAWWYPSISTVGLWIFTSFRDHVATSSKGHN